ncbi:PHP domain-containing protein [Acinetobacter baumannii]|nr:PHP domain-containing protein [Acinetobacter baumannii]
MLNHAMSVQSDFSIGKSLLTVDKIVEAAKGLGYSSVAIVDDMSLHALVDFSNKATKANIKPVFGCRLRVYDDSKYRKPPASSGIAEKRNLMFCPKVYVKSEKGIKGLFKLLTDANSKEQYYYHSRTDLDALCKLEDVVVTTGDMYGLFSHPDHERILKVLKARFGDDLYIEFSPINTPLFDRLNYLGYLAYEREKIKTVYQNERAARAVAQAAKVKLKFESLEALLYEAYRKHFLANGEKVTEKAVENAVRKDSRWIKAKELYIEAEMYADIHKGFVYALRDRNDMLIQRGAYSRQERQGQLRMNEYQEQHIQTFSQGREAAQHAMKKNRNLS